MILVLASFENLCVMKQARENINGGKEYGMRIGMDTALKQLSVLFVLWRLEKQYLPAIVQLVDLHSELFASISFLTNTS